MNFFEQIKNVFTRRDIGNVLADELYQAQRDLIAAEAHSELYSALATVYRGRVSRLSRKVGDQVVKQVTELNV